MGESAFQAVANSRKACELPFMGSFKDIDWSQEKPAASTLLADWLAVGVVELGSDHPSLTAIQGAFEETHSNGGALIGRFAIEAPPSWQWYISRNRLEEATFFSRFFRHPAVTRALPSLGAPLPSDDELGFRQTSPFRSVAHVADSLLQGGAYRDFKGSDKALCKLIGDFADAAFGGRYSDVCAYASHSGWSPWFKSSRGIPMIWDFSILWFDKLDGVATTLFVTDED